MKHLDFHSNGTHRMAKKWMILLLVLLCCILTACTTNNADQVTQQDTAQQGTSQSFSPNMNQAYLDALGAIDHTCYVCSGTGLATCLNCGGRGTIGHAAQSYDTSTGWGQEWITNNCNACNGTGKVRCTSCGGTGQIR